LDDFIKKTIIDARRSYDYLEWIPFENFKDIKKIGRGGFATAYLATRTKCLTGHFVWDNKNNKYVRNNWRNYPVVLKAFHNKPDISKTFLNEIKTHHKCMMMQEDGFLQCYGISRNPETNEFITVLDYAKNGDLRHFLQQKHQTLKWNDRLDIVTKVAKDLKVIHQTGLIHGDFHSGNVLQVGNSRVSDFGLSRVDNGHIPEGGVFGVVPYIAPEVLGKKAYRQPADVYSYGIILWEVSSGKPAFCDIPHDYILVSNICFKGKRPEIINGTPPCYVELMQRCWDNDPKKRPTAEEIYETCLKWSNIVKEQKVESDIYQQFLNADRSPNTTHNAAKAAPKINPNAIYTSRLINYVTEQFDLSIENYLPDLPE